MSDVRMSYSALRTYLNNPDQFYLMYVAKAPRMTQTDPMILGLRVDKAIKECLAGREPMPGVEKFIDAYGVERISKLKTPTHETEVEVSANIDGIPVIGYIDYKDGNFILDWKVNGYYSKYGAKNPTPRNSMYREFKGHRINYCTTFENVKDDWALQLSLYLTMIGVPLTELSPVGIDQFICKDKEIISVEQHRYVISKDYRAQTIEMLKEAYEYSQIPNTRIDDLACKMREWTQYEIDVFYEHGS